jgi:hypothetical protein
MPARRLPCEVCRLSCQQPAWHLPYPACSAPLETSTAPGASLSLCQPALCHHPNLVGPARRRFRESRPLPRSVGPRRLCAAYWAGMPRKAAGRQDASRVAMRLDAHAMAACNGRQLMPISAFGRWALFIACCIHPELHGLL